MCADEDDNKTLLTGALQRQCLREATRGVPSDQEAPSRVAAPVPRAGQRRHGLLRTASHPHAARGEEKSPEIRVNDDAQRMEKKGRAQPTTGMKSGSTAGKKEHSQLQGTR